jgi:acetate kinase
VISATSSRVTVRVIATDEALMIATSVRNLLRFGAIRKA